LGHHKNKNALLNNQHSCLFCIPGKRKRGQQDVVAALVEMQAADERQQEWLERMEDRRDRRFEMMLDDAREARRHEAEITRQHMEQSASFNQAFLGTLSQLVQALNSRRDPVP
jgi:methylphosphotriester-DNA--protein-cysteine methyltransferase